MYIEWDLQAPASGVGSTNWPWRHESDLIEEIDSWAVRVEIAYKTKRVKYKFRLILHSEKDYSHFTLSWNPNVTHSWHSWLNEYRIVDPMKINHKL